MKKVVTVFASVLLVGLVFISSEIAIQACNVTPGCMSTGHTVICGSRHGDYLYSHQYKHPNGVYVNCYVTRESASHTIKCSGCGAVLTSGETRTCNILHNYCLDSQYNMCQY